VQLKREHQVDYIIKTTKINFDGVFLKGGKLFKIHDEIKNKQLPNATCVKRTKKNSSENYEIKKHKMLSNFTIKIIPIL